jgi:hypothetical protein
MKTYLSKSSILSWMTALFAINLSNSSFCSYLCTSLTTDTFPFPFNLDHIGLASCAFCVTLVARLAGSLPHDINGPAISTANRAGHRPTYSAALYQLKK